MPNDFGHLSRWTDQRLIRPQGSARKHRYDGGASKNLQPKKEVFRLPNIRGVSRMVEAVKFLEGKVK